MRPSGSVQEKNNIPFRNREWRPKVDFYVQKVEKVFNTKFRSVQNWKKWCSKMQIAYSYQD